MNSKVLVSECGTWVHTRVEGPITLESALEFITEAARQADTCGLDNFLFDVRGAFNAKSILHDYQIANYHLRGLGFSLASRVALLVSPGDKTHDFFELTAANAGHSWKVFEDEGVAVDWVRREKAPASSFGPEQS